MFPSFDPDEFRAVLVRGKENGSAEAGFWVCEVFDGGAEEFVEGFVGLLAGVGAVFEGLTGGTWDVCFLAAQGA